MTALIKGFEIPKQCADCWFMDGEDHLCCAMRGRHIDSNYFYGIKDRPDWCPLVELPPHGRLIDADALEYHADNVRDPMGRTEKTVMWKKIEAASTIIPAE